MVVIKLLKKFNWSLKLIRVIWILPVYLQLIDFSSYRKEILYNSVFAQCTTNIIYTFALVYPGVICKKQYAINGFVSWCYIDKRISRRKPDSMEFGFNIIIGPLPNLPTVLNSTTLDFYFPMNIIKALPKNSIPFRNDGYKYWCRI